MNHNVSNVKKKIEKRQTLAKLIEKSFLIYPLTTNNATCHDSLTLNLSKYPLHSPPFAYISTYNWLNLLNSVLKSHRGKMCIL